MRLVFRLFTPFRGQGGRLNFSIAFLFNSSLQSPALKTRNFELCFGRYFPTSSLHWSCFRRWDCRCIFIIAKGHWNQYLFSLSRNVMMTRWQWRKCHPVVRNFWKNIASKIKTAVMTRSKSSARISLQCCPASSIGHRSLVNSITH